MQADLYESYAVAVRDTELFLFWIIRRHRKSGDVYVNWPRVDEWWAPHASYHASGQFHHKAHGLKMLVRCHQKPDKNFTGIRNLATSGIAKDEPRAINEPCKANEFADVFELPCHEIGVEKYRTVLSADLLEPNQELPLPKESIVRQVIFKGKIPWIAVTLTDADRLSDDFTPWSE